MKSGILISLVLAACAGSCPAETLTYPDLARRIYDLEALAVKPPAGERTGLASSYDRGSRYDAARDKYIGWDANSDGSGIVRKEGDKAVLAEINGPGCVWRIWTATAGQGHVKIYLDGSDTPAVDLPFADFFNGKAAPFNRKNLSYETTAKGFDSFVPIPFQKSCKVVKLLSFQLHDLRSWHRGPDVQAPARTR